MKILYISSDYREMLLSDSDATIRFQDTYSKVLLQAMFEYIPFRKSDDILKITSLSSSQLPFNRGYIVAYYPNMTVAEYF
jgi:hypothetical protein